MEALPNGVCLVPRRGLENLVNLPVSGLYTHLVYPNIGQIQSDFSGGGDLRIAELIFRVCERVRNMNQPEL